MSSGRPPTKTENPYDFTMPESIEELATLLETQSQLLNDLTSPLSKNEYYERMRIPKRNSKSECKFRIVWKCKSEETANLHKSFARRFEKFMLSKGCYPGDVAHGYIHGRSTRSNAKPHAGSKCILKADIKDFFNSIDIDRLIQSLEDLGIHSPVARGIAELCTIDDKLTLGLHASPILANVVCRSLDEKLHSLAVETDTQVTRYGDDITFSGQSKLPEKERVVQIIESENFALAEHKFRITKRGWFHCVTGLSVSDDYPRIPRRIKKKIRQELYYVDKFGLCQHMARSKCSWIQQKYVNHIDGTIRYINGIEPDLGKKLRTLWRLIQKEEEVRPNYSAVVSDEDNCAKVYIDETEIPINNTESSRVLALGLSVIKNNDLDSGLRQILRNFIVDPHLTGRKKALKKKGLHCTEMSEDQRTEVFKFLSTSDFRGYIAYDILDEKDSNSYQKKYSDLMRVLLRDVFAHCNNMEVEIIVEENQQIKIETIKNVCKDLYGGLSCKNSLRPSRLPVLIKGKKMEHPPLSVPDFILAAFFHYAIYNKPFKSKEEKEKHAKSGEQIVKRFNRVRDKIKKIYSVPTGEQFWRRKPFHPWPEGNPAIEFQGDSNSNNIET